MAAMAMRETPDVETASEDYARRFAGPVGRYLLDCQDESLEAVLEGFDGESVLDVGGGHAQLVPKLSEGSRRVVVFGSDTAAFVRMRRKYPGCAMVAGDLLNLPFPDRSFDLVTAVRLISHVEAWRHLVAELCRVARRTVVIDFPRCTGLNALTPLLFPLKKRIEGNTRSYRNFSDAELDAAFESCSFVATARYPQFFFPMGIHRRLNASGLPRRVERAARRLELTSRWGSPVMLRADRSPRS